MSKSRTPTAPPAAASAAVRLPARAPMPRRMSGWLLWGWNGLRRAPWSAAAAGAVLAFLGGAAHFAINADYFLLRSVEVLGAHRTPAAEVEALVRGGTDRPLLPMLAPRRLEGEISALPTVRAARVTRHWPDRIEVALVEHQPRTVLLHPTGAFLVGDGGLVLARADVRALREADGPLLTGFEGTMPVPGQELPQEAWWRTLTTRETIRRASPEIHRLLSEVHWDERLGVSLVLRDGARVLVGRRDIAEAGPALEAFLAADEARARRVRRVDLRAPTHLAWSPWPPPEPPRRGAPRSGNR